MRNYNLMTHRYIDCRSKYLHCRNIEIFVFFTISIPLMVHHLKRMRLRNENYRITAKFFAEIAEFAKMRIFFASKI